MDEQAHSAASNSSCSSDDSIIFGEDDTDGEEGDLIVLAAVVACNQAKKQRQSAYIRDRLEWEEHVQRLNFDSPDAFAHMYRMSHKSFQKLVRILQPRISRDKNMAKVKTSGKGPNTSEVALHCLLRWLAGGSYLDIHISAGLSVPLFYCIIYLCIDAILAAEDFHYEFPTNVEKAAEDFQNISSNSAIQGCVACIDGYFLSIQTPSSNKTQNVKAYYSGHCCKYGVNVQAACDHRSRFVSVCIAAPDGVNDIAAFRKTKVRELIHDLPIGKYAIGDNACVCTEHLLTPFSGNERLDTTSDSYNFYLSQLRIRIEMAFGIMTEKWQILRKPLRVKLKNVGKVFLCITRLHNYCINEWCSDYKTFDVESAMQRLRETDEAPPDPTVEAIQGRSIMRERLVARIFDLGLARPARNLKQNNIDNEYL